MERKKSKKKHHKKFRNEAGERSRDSTPDSRPRSHSRPRTQRRRLDDSSPENHLSRRSGRRLEESSPEHHQPRQSRRSVRRVNDSSPEDYQSRPRRSKSEYGVKLTRKLRFEDEERVRPKQKRTIGAERPKNFCAWMTKESRDEQPRLRVFGVEEDCFLVTTEESETNEESTDTDELSSGMQDLELRDQGACGFDRRKSSSKSSSKSSRSSDSARTMNTGGSRQSSLHDIDSDDDEIVIEREVAVYRGSENRVLGRQEICLRCRQERRPGHRCSRVYEGPRGSNESFINERRKGNGYRK